MTTRNKKINTRGELSFKMILVGNSAAGKSSLLTRYTKDEFKNEYNVTVGICKSNVGV